MHTDKAIAEFEAFALKEFGLQPAHLIKDADSGCYVNYPVQCYLDVWLASRAAVVVDLPDPYIGDFLVQQDCRAAIEAAGVTVRG